MAVQAGLINPQISMAVKPFAPDIAGSIAAGYNMRGDIIGQQQKEQAIGRENQDREVMSEYLKSGGDVYTPTGIEKALTDLKGKTSPDLYMKLADHAAKVKDADIRHKQELLGLDESQLKLRSVQTEKLLGYLANPLSVYDQTAATAGAQEAEAKFSEARNQVLAAAAKESINGQPLFPPQILQQMATATPDHLKGLLAGTKYSKDLIDQRLKESQIVRNRGLADFDEARAKALQNPKVAGSGAAGQIAAIQAMVEQGRLDPSQAKTMVDGIVAKTSKPAEVSGLTPDAIDRAAQEHYTFGTLPARLGPAERSAILNRSAQIAEESGDTSEAAVIRQQANKANRLALNDITKRENMTAVFEKDADKRLGLVQQLAKKADLSGSPAIARWERAGRQTIAGDEDVNNLNSAMISLQAELAKVLSGSLTNAGVSDAARFEASQIINANMSSGMIDSLIPNIRKELKFKMDSFKEQRESLTNAMKGPPRKAATDETKVSPATQTERDKDAGSILLKEYQDKKAKLATIKGDTPESKAAKIRATEDLAELGRELTRAGVKDFDKTTPKAKASQVPNANSKGWVLHVDKAGNQAYVSPDGKQFEEVK